MGLTPADLDRCQAETHIKRSPFTMGGRIIEVERCKNKPVVIVTEVVPGEDGERGSMSLCGACLEIFAKEDSRAVEVYLLRHP